MLELKRQPRIIGGRMLFACGLLVAFAGPVLASAAEMLPAMIRWSSDDLRSLSDSPLDLLADGEGTRVRGEWAPLYRDASGARFEWSKQSYDWRGGGRTRRLGVSLTQERTVWRELQPVWGVGRVVNDPARLALVWGGTFGPMTIAAAGGTNRGLTPGFALAARVAPAQRWRGEVTWSRWAQQGEYDTHYQDAQVQAGAQWHEEYLGMGLGGPTRVGDFHVRLEATEHRPGATPPRDAMQQELSWRSIALDLAPRASSRAMRLHLEHGIGRSSVLAWHGGTRFAELHSGLTNDLASVELRPRAIGGTVRAWAGSWRSDHDGTLATWPFETLTLITGTRVYASGAARLVHFGASFDRTPTGRAWEAGLSSMWVRPQLQYESWQGRLFGLGRDDVQSGGIGLNSGVFGGLRVAATHNFAWLFVRGEAVQWFPIALAQVASSHGAAGSTGGTSSVGGGVAATGSAWGGTLVRLTLATR